MNGHSLIVLHVSFVHGIENHTVAAVHHHPLQHTFLDLFRHLSHLDDNADISNLFF